jgi:hypothetical protein
MAPFSDTWEKKKKQNVLKIVFVVLLLVYESEQAP